MLVKLDGVEYLKNKILSLIIIRLLRSLVVKWNLIRIWLLNHTGTKVIYWHLIWWVIWNWLVYLLWQSFLNILKYLILWSLSKIINKRILIHIHILFLIVHKIRILILMNELRLLHHLCHRHLLDITSVLFRLRLIILLYLIWLLRLWRRLVTDIWFSVSTIITVIILRSCLLRNLRWSSIVLSCFLDVLTYLWGKR